MRRLSRAIIRWFDSQEHSTPDGEHVSDRIDLARCAPFIAMHLVCLAAIWTGVSWTAVAVGAGLFFVRMFAITGFYHRYFSHRTFRTSRPFQFAMALVANSSVQRGPLWWAANHRHHHNHSDDEPDHHSPGLRGFLMSHMGWFMTDAGFRTNERLVRDWMKYPELRLIDRFDWIVPVLLAAGLFLAGFLAERFAPGLGTNGWQMLIWGFFISTIVLFHSTYTINSLAHQFGSQRFKTGDDSRNNLLLALLTLGEGWHNNHHHYPASTRQGFYWWEIDLTYYGLKALSWTGLIWDLRPVPKHVLEQGRASLHRVPEPVVHS